MTARPPRKKKNNKTDGTKNLIPLNKRTKEERQAIGKKGGLVKSIEKSESQKWRYMRERLMKKGYEAEDIDWMMQKIHSRDSMTGDIMMFIDTLKDRLAPEQAVQLGNLMVNVAKFHHGDRMSVETKNINLNISNEETKSKIEEHLKKIFGKKKKK